MSILSFIFDATRRELMRARGIVGGINALGPEMQQLTDEQMRAKTDEFRDRLAHGETLDDLLVEAYALVREATWRVLGNRQIRFRVYREGLAVPEDVILPLQDADQYEEQLQAQRLRYEREKFMAHFDVQMVGGILLHWGRVAEMRTGEGKTQVAVLALYLNAIEGKGAHLLTHNDYLAKRDRDWMAPIFESLGLTVGAIQHDISHEERQEAYACDITYATNSEVGFDYLRDNTVDYADWLVLRDVNFAIVDEADSLLIDEARVPLILAGAGAKPTEMYRRVDRVIPRLTKDTDYIVDEKTKTAALAEDGIRKLERDLGVSNLSDPENLELYQHVNAALRAHACYKRDVDYVVRDGKVILVDEFTGRLMYGRRYAEGLHQAIEAKEKVQIERENVTTATITHQNFFRLYKKLAGMTGTAKTEEAEFIKVYGAPVAVIPTHRPMIRKDNPDMIYKTQEAKYHGITAEILRMRSMGRPTLVGTRSIEVSERLSERLKTEKLQLLAQLILLEYALLESRGLDRGERRELARALRGRLGEVEREVRHLESAVSKFDYSTLRIAQPEEQRRLEHRLVRTTRVTEEIQGLISRLEGQESVSGGDVRRTAEIICFQPLEEISMGRPAALVRALGIDPDVTRPENTKRLAELIGLQEEEHERLGEVLERGIPHRVLNAKYHEMEAHIIAQAGRPGALTIATNMAGRGVDILLGGNPQEVANELLRRDGIEPDQASEEQRQAALKEAQALCARDKERVLALGGLHILGTERHESRRIDNQLRGRSGRQGDPGSSRFYVSFEDELMRLFGPERLDFFLSKWPENEPIEARITSRMIENAQKKVEAHYFEMRKHRLQYDDVMNHQRALIYEQRHRVLMGEDLRNTVVSHMREFVEARTKEFASPEIHPDDWNLEALHQALSEVYPAGVTLEQIAEYRHHEELLEFLQEDIAAAYEERERLAGEEQLRELERLVTLRVVSARWIDHLAAIEYLEEGIGLRGYSGVDPLIIYRKESYDYWQQLLATIREDIIRYLFRVEIEPQETEEERRARIGLGRGPQGRPVEAAEQEGMAAAAGAATPAARAGTALKAPPSREAPRRRAAQRAGPKVGRNDPCPCGSGRKYKKCCGRAGGR
ncbi:MAG TPA: preprotein translocase subunit SecA [Armatimonadota bacterium]|nr:preprotein translocase subunit SecA [Armatimonadota bacterium]